MDIRDLELSSRARNALLQESIDTVELLATMSFSDLLDIPNLGIVSASEIADLLAGRGILISGYAPLHLPSGSHKPKRRTAKIYYWSCAVSEHRHSSKQGAMRCVEFTSRQRKNDRKWTDQRFAECQSLRDSGKTLAEIGRHFGLSVERIRQVLAQWERIQRRRAQCPPANPPK